MAAATQRRRRSLFAAAAAPEAVADWFEIRICGVEVEGIVIGGAEVSSAAFAFLRQTEKEEGEYM